MAPQSKGSQDLKKTCHQTSQSYFPNSQFFFWYVALLLLEYKGDL
jgi:hypothetical protein